MIIMTKMSFIRSPRQLLFLTVFLALLPVTHLWAQHKNRDAVYLRQGSVVTGVLTMYDSIQGISITNKCGIWKFSFAEVDSVKLFARVQNATWSKSDYYNLSSVGLLFGEGSDGYKPYVSLTMVNGWQFNQHLYAGAGIGYEFYEWGVMPLFADVKYILNSNPVTPVFSCRVGYGFPLSKSNNNSDFYEPAGKTFGGVLLNPEVGIGIPIGQNALLISLGYHYQELSYEEQLYQWSYYQSKRVYTHFNRISLRLGFVF